MKIFGPEMRMHEGEKEGEKVTCAVQRVGLLRRRHEGADGRARDRRLQRRRPRAPKPDTPTASRLFYRDFFARIAHRPAR